MKTQTIILTILAVAGVQTAAAAEPVPYGHPDFYPSATRPAGLRGDGSGTFPAATPVTTWDWTTGKNIVWATPLPSFGSSSPIVVGDKVFVTAELNQLICINARDGKIPWIREVDSIPIVAKGKADEVRAKWKKYWGQHAEGHAIYWEHQFLGWKLALIDSARNGTEFPPKKAKKGGLWTPLCLNQDEFAKLKAAHKSTPDAEVAAIEARRAELAKIIAEREYEPQTTGYVGTANPHKRGSETQRAFGKKWGPLAQELRKNYQLALCMWNGFMNAFSTPISDGQFVYVQMDQGQVACYDLDGKQQWIRVFVDDPKFNHSGLGQNYAVSPLLADDKLVVTFGGGRGTRMVIRCLEKKTGKLLWAKDDLPLNSAHSFNYISRIHHGDIDAIISGSNLILDTATGAVISDVRPWVFCVAPPMVVGDTAFLMGGGGQCGNQRMLAVRLERVDGKVRCRYSWAAVPSGDGRGVNNGKINARELLRKADPEIKFIDPVKGKWESTTAGIFHKGKLYFPQKFFTVDVATGDCEVWHKGKDRHGKSYGGSKGHAILAGDYLVYNGHTNESLSASGAITRGRTAMVKLADPAVGVGVNHVGSLVHRQLQLGEISVEQVLRMIREHHYSPEASLMMQTTPWAQGDRLYLRTRDTVFCVGDPSKPYHSPAEAPAAAKTE